MKRMIYFLYIFLLIILFLPKERVYYSFESLLSEYHLFVTNETINDQFFYLDVQNGEIVLDNQTIATIESIRVIPLIFVNRLSLSNLEPLTVYRNFFPGKIDKIVLTYSLFSPLEVSVEGEGNFGHFRGMIDLMDKKLRIVFDVTSQLRGYPFLVSALHQEQEGLVYESSF